MGQHYPVAPVKYDLLSKLAVNAFIDQTDQDHHEITMLDLYKRNQWLKTSTYIQPTSVVSYPGHVRPLSRHREQNGSSPLHCSLNQQVTQPDLHRKDQECLDLPSSAFSAFNPINSSTHGAFQAANGVYRSL
jgi:hypothetical protein